MESRSRGPQHADEMPEQCENDYESEEKNYDKQKRAAETPEKRSKSRAIGWTDRRYQQKCKAFKTPEQMTTLKQEIYLNSKF